MSSSAEKSLFMRFAAAVADFGDPFYAEERQRDVWNEASAFGFQFLVWAGMALSAVMLWVGGRPLLPYAFALLILIVAASYLVIAYARLLGVRVAVKGSLTRPRLMAFAVVYAALILGAVRSVGTGGLDRPGLMIGLAVGAGGLTGLLIGMDRQRRRQERAAERGEVDDVTHPGL
ncbi:MAG: hypothetical protein WAL50_07465 [Kineosporiaceae bacterium]|jgi:hypothetical protein